MSFKSVILSILVFVAAMSASRRAWADEERVICDFEDPVSLRLWGKPDHILLTDDHASQGRKCAQVGVALRKWSNLAASAVRGPSSGSFRTRQMVCSTSTSQA